MSDYSRRELLAAAGAATTVAVAGCSESAASGGDGTAVLGDISVENLHDEGHTVDVVVEFGDEIDHWSTHELDADEGETIERDWPTDAGTFRVTARLDGGDPVQVTPSMWNDPDCLNLFVLVTREGDLELWSDTSGGPCGAGDPNPDDGAAGTG